MRAKSSLLCLALLAPFYANAHEGPEHEIEEITARMKQRGESADLLTERAVEYRVLGKLAEAVGDLERAAVLEPRSIAIRRELGRALFLSGKTNEALSAATLGLTLKTDEPAELASLRMLRAEILRSQNDNRKAIEDCDAALRLHKGNPEWYLLRSDVQRRLKMHKERVAGLDEGIKETGAGILEIERVEAMLDAGQSNASLAIIERELAESRIKSSWLIRRARALLALGNTAAAGDNLRSALEEIGKRLNPKSPDVPLLMDKATALELLGEKKEALRAYEEARDKGAGDTLNEKIKSLQDSMRPAPPK